MKQSQSLGVAIASLHYITLAMTKYVFKHLGYSPDLESGEEVMLFHPQQQVWTEHFAWSESGKELKGLTAVVRATIKALHMNRPALVRARAMWIKLGEHPPQLS